MSILTHGTDYARQFQRQPEKVARDIQGLFFQVLAKELQRSLPKDAWLGSGPGAQMAGDLFSQAMAQQAATSLDLGLLNSLRSQMGIPESEGAPELSSSISYPPRALPRHLPVEGRISSEYGYRKDPIDGDRRFHHGMDIAAQLGQPIRSVSSGVVTLAGSLGGFGKTVRVRMENGTELTYAHCNKLLVKSGDRVRPGTTLGEVGSSGRSTGPHLHFEVRTQGGSVDPHRWLGTHSVLMAQR